MHSFARRQIQPQRRDRSGFVRPNTIVAGSNHHAHIVLELRREISSEAEHPISQPGPADLNGGLPNTASLPFGHDFSRVPTRFPGALSLQTKMVTNKVGDEHEQEADRIAQQALDMTEPELQRASPRGGECPKSETEQAPHKQERVLTRRSGSSDLEPTVLAPMVNEMLRAPGQPLDQPFRTFIQSRLGHDFSSVRVHADPRSSRSALELQAHAYTVGRHIAFAPGRYRPDTIEGKRLMAHELVHVAQQGAAPTLLRAPAYVTPPLVATVSNSSVARVAKKASTIEVDLISSLDEYQPPGTRETYRVGDASASSVLMDIQERGAKVVFRVFNFETGVAEQMSPAKWSFLRGAAIIGGGNAGITRLGRQLSASQWRSLWPNPMPELLRMFEAGQVTLDDEALLSGYHGMIRSYAATSLEENEHTIDEFLGAPDRVHRIQEYAAGLREASLVRDALLQRRDELSRRLVAQHSFTFVLPHTGTGPNAVQQLSIRRERGEVEDTISFWLSAFPLLTRLQTHEIGATPVEDKLREIKANIVSTRQELSRGKLDPMTLDTVRARIAGKLGPRATAAVAAEDRSRMRWAIAGGLATLAASIGILFLPGGVFIDAAIGVAIAGHAIANAAELGHAANTGLHVDDGLVSQSQAGEGKFAAVLATVFAIMGVAAAGFRVLRVGLALRGLGRSMPELAPAERALWARAIVERRLVLESGRRLSAEETAFISTLLREGRIVRTLAESSSERVRTADFVVDGVRTELKSISSITSPDPSGALARRILEGAGQAPHIIADVRLQSGMTRQLADRAIRRAFGADTSRRILQIRVIGNGFDETVPRIP